MEGASEQSVKVAVNIRPLIPAEISSGCDACVLATPGQPQLQVLPDKLYTFDHVYGGGGPPMENLFGECILPLVEGVFQGYNATVFAYGQTGSGKTYTMGTGYTAGNLDNGVAPHVMNAIFDRVEQMKPASRFEIRVSLIEIHKDTIKDLLDSPAQEATDRKGGAAPGGSEKPPITIRDSGDLGGVVMVGATELIMHTRQDMRACLEQGLLLRATGGHQKNDRSSRSHAIFTITVDQQKRQQCVEEGASPTYIELCAKMHLVDLAGSERIKRTKAEGQRMVEGIHINKGLLALGNVISALGDDKMRRKDGGGHVPYRDSKLTRLLQDSLGGNSRTIMIACVSPADVDVEETLNTLKYANRARNIQNKPTVNLVSDSLTGELTKLRHQVEVLQEEITSLRNGEPMAADEERQVLRQRIAFLEASNARFMQGLAEGRDKQRRVAERAAEAEAEKERLAEEATAREAEKSLMHAELESSEETITRLRAATDAVRAAAQSEVEAMRQSDREFREQFAALREKARVEAESLWRSEAQLRQEVAAAQEKARAESKRALAAEMGEKQVRLQMSSLEQQLEVASRKVRAAESAGHTLQGLLEAHAEKARGEARALREENAQLRSEMERIKQAAQEDRARRAETASAAKHTASRLEEATDRARMESERAAEAQAEVLATQAKLVQLSCQLAELRDQEAERAEIGEGASKEVQRQLASAQEQVEAETRKTLEVQTALGHVQSLLQTSQEDWRKEQRRADELAESVQSLEQRVADWEGRVMEAEAGQQELRLALSEREERVLELEASLESSRVALTEELARRSDLDEQIAALQRDLANLQESSEAELRHREEALLLAESSRSDLMTELLGVKGEKAALQESLQSSTAHLEETRVSLTKAQVDLVVARSSSQAAWERAEQAEGAVQSLRGEVGTAMAQLSLEIHKRKEEVQAAEVAAAVLAERAEESQEDEKEGATRSGADNADAHEGPSGVETANQAMSEGVEGGSVSATGSLRWTKGLKSANAHSSPSLLQSWFWKPFDLDAGDEAHLRSDNDIQRRWKEISSTTAAKGSASEAQPGSAEGAHEASEAAEAATIAVQGPGPVSGPSGQSGSHLPGGMWGGGRRLMKQVEKRLLRPGEGHHNGAALSRSLEATPPLPQGKFSGDEAPSAGGIDSPSGRSGGIRAAQGAPDAGEEEKRKSLGREGRYREEPELLRAESSSRDGHPRAALEQIKGQNERGGGEGGASAEAASVTEKNAQELGASTKVIEGDGPPHSPTSVLLLPSSHSPPSPNSLEYPLLPSEGGTVAVIPSLFAVKMTSPFPRSQHGAPPMPPLSEVAAPVGSDPSCASHETSQNKQQQQRELQELLVPEQSATQQQIDDQAHPLRQGSSPLPSPASRSEKGVRRVSSARFLRFGALGSGSGRPAPAPFSAADQLPHTGSPPVAPKLPSKASGSSGVLGFKSISLPPRNSSPSSPFTSSSSALRLFSASLSRTSAPSDGQPQDKLRRMLSLDVRPSCLSPSVISPGATSSPRGHPPASSPTTQPIVSPAPDASVTSSPWQQPSNGGHPDFYPALESPLSHHLSASGSGQYARSPHGGHSPIRDALMPYSPSAGGGISSPRVWGSAALGLHGRESPEVAASAGPAGGPSRAALSTACPVSPSQSERAAAARERVAWEPYTFNAASVAALKRASGGRTGESQQQQQVAVAAGGGLT
eukprot:TRINITY_DN16934_c0_g1_i1.p1 TRINITY_DN16934_c0_g1~~TRINITY_DN16934_c0_g1_i1.p1  ORF type:complete len:1702 (+),score=377.56 TRINITY_DN16934_c0_g1_i1:37-5142(+)